MKIFDTDKKIVVVYLSRTGCLAYTKEIVRGLAASDPLLILSPSNKEQFPDCNKIYFKTYTKAYHLLLHSLFVQARIEKLMEGILSEHKTVQLYLPAFHPWNLHFAKWAKKNGVPCIITIHDYKTHLGEQSALIENIQKKTIALASRVIFLTKFVRQQCIAELGPSEKYFVSSHPILPAHATNSLPHADRPKLLFLGRVVGYKGLPLITEAIKGMDLELTIAGKQTKLNIQATSNITVIDKVLTDAEISELLATHEILVLPYTEASQSGVLTLGISAEMVMLITKVGGLEEQLAEDAACWVEASVEGIKAGLERLVEDREYFNELKEKVAAVKLSMTN